MTETMRERMARAVFEIRTKRQHGAPDPWLEMTPMGKLQYFTIVDAILDVLAEPSEALIEAGGSAVNSVCGCLSYHHGRKVAVGGLQAMLTAIREGK